MQAPPPKQDLGKLKTGREDIGGSTRQNKEMAQQNQNEPAKQQPVMVKENQVEMNELSC